MKIGIVGAGNMGGAIAHGLLQSKAVEPACLYMIDICSDKLQPFAELGVNTSLHSAAIMDEADIVMIAVKPWLALETLHKLRPTLRQQAMVVSIAAGITLEQIRVEVQGLPIFRVIPNTAIAAGQSMTFIASDGTSREQEQTILSLFAGLGKAMLIPEQQMAAATALSSCGIAYAMRYISANMRAGVELGFTPDVAREIMLQTLQGAVSLLSYSGEHPEKEIDRVTTPKGLTIKGINQLEHGGFTSAIVNAVKAAM
ncbi:MAG: pyrroline-5-carboxylate reductase [Prevotellaceae bacterium]|jgi:pyrroline-5-carboxylate reductase|nr:pyrroline-5-carboxylate reductase [Prevotellaceae bacterium]